MKPFTPKSDFLDTPGKEHLTILARAVSVIEDYAIFLLDPDGSILTWNRGAERMKGYSARDVIGKHFSIFYGPEDLAAGKPKRELEIARTAGKYEEEGTRYRKDGSSFWASVVITAVCGDDGTVIGFSKVTRDLTERKKIEETLRFSEERFRTLIETVQDYAIFMLDEKGFITSWNAGAERFKRYKAAEIIGQHFSKFYPEEDKRSRKPERELQTAASEGRCTDEGWRIRKDGTRFWAYVVITALRDKRGRLIGFSKVTRDLTERKLAEELLEKSNADLEKRIAERTAELIEKNKDLEQFAYVASHDLQEPLRKIIAFSERLREFNESGNERQSEYTDKINKSAQRMRTVIEDLLSYSRVHAEAMQKRPTDLSALLADALSDLELLIAQTGTRVDAEPLPVLEIHPTAIRHLFQNLLLNSIKFCKPGVPPRIQVRSKKTPESVELHFIDNGIGFEQKYAYEIFKPFRRLHTKQEYEGTGIGLALCEKVAHQHGGSIAAHGRPGVGATFVLTLPLPPIR